MKINVNTKVIKSLNPCKDRLDNYNGYYANFSGDIVKFLKLSNVSYSDKLWTALQLIPLDMKIVFAMDMAFSAAQSILNTTSKEYSWESVPAAAECATHVMEFATSTHLPKYATHASHSAVSAANFALAAADNKEKEEKSQLEALIYLIERE